MMGVDEETTICQSHKAPNEPNKAKKQVKTKEQKFQDFLVDMFTTTTTTDAKIIVERVQPHQTRIHDTSGREQQLQQTAQRDKPSSLIEMLQQSSGGSRLTARQLRAARLDASLGADDEDLGGGVEPIKLNFSQEAIDEEEQALPSLNDFPSLKDLETSNLFSNRFHGELANKLALQSLGVASATHLNALTEGLVGSEPVTLKAHFERTGKRDRKQVVGLFSSLLALTQLGLVQLH